MNPGAFGGFNGFHPPFHPYCLEIFRRASKLRLGGADLLNLADWVDRCDSNTPHHNSSEAPLHPAVDRGHDQWWCHRPGDEFLVADPLHSQGLSTLLEAAKRPQHDFDAKGSPFRKSGENPTAPTDLYGKLPEKLRNMILAPLDSQDVANLRLASRSFRHLPYTLWHDLVKKEMPWIWEAWTDRPYPHMSRTTKKELIAHDEAIQNRTQAAAALPLGSQQKTIEEERIACDDAEFRKPRPVEQLDRFHTDWYYLYCQLRREWKTIKGLQNRERIWKAAEFVIRRVASPDQDLHVAKEEHAKAFPYKDLNPVSYGG